MAPLRHAVYAAKGVLLGWLAFTNDWASRSDVQGGLGWIKPPQTKAKCYPDGFSCPLIEGARNAFGSHYTHHSPLLGWSNGVLVLEYGNLSQQLTCPLLLSGDRPLWRMTSSMPVTLAEGAR